MNPIIVDGQQLKNKDKIKELEYAHIVVLLLKVLIILDITEIIVKVIPQRAPHFKGSEHYTLPSNLHNITSASHHFMVASIYV